MNIKEILEKSNLSLQKDKILYNEPMKKYTTFKIGGPAECLVKVTEIEELQEILKIANENNIPLTILGNGSNVLISDKGIKGITLIIKIEKLDIVKNEKENKFKIVIGAGEKIGKVARIFLKENIAGFEELSGIPGTFGGAVRMNAGAHGKEMKDVVKKVTCVTRNGKVLELSNEEMKFEYRRSLLKEKDYIVVEIEIELEEGKQEEIKEKMDKYLNFRKEKQPLEYPNAGSTFKRGSDFITAQLIDQAGLKGYAVGDAEVSTKHSGFVINKGEAKAKDVLKLVKHIKETIEEKNGKKIELEIEILGEVEESLR